MNHSWHLASRWLIGWALLAGVCGCDRVGGLRSGPGIFIVATNGNDAWSGGLAKPNAAGTDGPFASLPRALAATRDVARTNPAIERIIYLADGPHFLSAALVLRPEDSGLHIEEVKGARAILSGGVAITNWQEGQFNGKDVVYADLPATREGKWMFRQLWVNGTRAVRARHPNVGYLSLDRVPDTTKEWTDGQSRFGYKEGDLPAMGAPGDAEAVVMTRWVESRLPIATVDATNRLLLFGKRSVFQLAAGEPFYVEGAREALDAPGEWFLDRVAGRLYYYPRAGESLGNISAVAPALPQILRIEGEPEKGRFVENLRLEGIEFAHTEWYFPEGFEKDPARGAIWPPLTPAVGGFPQAAVGVPGAVWAEGLRNSDIGHCVFRNLGGYALELARGCQTNLIHDCLFEDLGAGGVRFGETSIRSTPGEVAQNNTIQDCVIRNGGRLFHSAIGIWIGQSPGNRILRNVVCDFYYTGISVGWTWGYGPALATNTLVAENHVHHIGVKSDGDGPILSDMGGIYTLGNHRGSVIANNVWHDIAGLRYGGWGIYFDEGTSGMLAVSNVVYRTTHGGFHQHYGASNTVVNNIFAFAREHQVQRSRDEPHLSFTFRTNIVYYNSGVLLGGTWKGTGYDLDYNLYFDARASASNNLPQFGPGTWAEWQKRGLDQHSVVGDPLFQAIENDDYRVLPESPARRLGFRPIAPLR